MCRGGGAHLCVPVVVQATIQGKHPAPSPSVIIVPYGNTKVKPKYCIDDIKTARSYEVQIGRKDEGEERDLLIGMAQYHGGLMTLLGSGLVSSRTVPPLELYSKLSYLKS